MAIASADDENNSIDRISDLPDDLLCHILSFLSSYYSIETSLLSTRFRNLWQSIPILDLTDMLCPVTINKLLEKILSSHERLSKLRKFRLRCYGLWYSQATISKLIESATASLEELDIRLRQCHRANLNLPSTFFSCRRLKTLVLGGGIALSSIPADACFPCLKTFNFISIKISILADDLFNMLLSAVCPELENFLIQDCYLEILGDNIINLEYLRGDLESASANVRVLKQLELHDTNVSRFVASATRCFARILSTAGRSGNCRPIFQQLRHLVAKVNCSSYLHVLLEHSPNLISLVLEKADSRKNWADPGEPDNVSQSSLCKNLETVQFHDFNGFQDLGPVKYFLRNAKVLKNLVLCVAAAVRLSDEIKASILHEIRVFSQCEVEFRD